MSDPSPPRKPRVFAADDPAVFDLPPQDEGPAATERDRSQTLIAAAARKRSTIAWGTLFVSAFASLAALAASVSFARFVAVAITRDDWIGWTATALLVLGLLAGAVIVGREIVGMFRLRKLAGLRAEAERAIASQDLKAEGAVARRLVALVGHRSDLAWPLARFREHQRDVLDAGALLALADRDLLAPLDTEARRLILKSSKRVATVTAISPLATIAVGFVAVENVRLMRLLATLYGGRPGFLGAMRLLRMVIAHLIATGGVALTDDLLGQFIGQDVLRRLSRRLGEGAFNGALTARLGTAAVEVARPLPFIEATPIRLRDFLTELFRKDKPAAPSPDQRGS